MAVDDHAAGTTNAFPAVVFESHGLFLAGYELFVEDVHHF
jgi:hypothetical protein